MLRRGANLMCVPSELCYYWMEYSVNVDYVELITSAVQLISILVIFGPLLCIRYWQRAFEIFIMEDLFISPFIFLPSSLIYFVSVLLGSRTFRIVMLLENRPFYLYVISTLSLGILLVLKLALSEMNVVIHFPFGWC